MRDITERYLNSLNGIDDDSPLFLSPNAEREYRESINEYKKHRKETMAFYNTLKEGLKRLDEIKQIGKNKIL
jgi:hypothetical protein